jgi:hypothetical protein
MPAQRLNAMDFNSSPNMRDGKQILDPNNPANDSYLKSGQAVAGTPEELDAIKANNVKVAEDYGPPSEPSEPTVPQEESYPSYDNDSNYSAPTQAEAESSNDSSYGVCEGGWGGESPGGTLGPTGRFKVTLSCDGKEVIFEASIPIGESRSASYDPYSIVHLPTDIFSFRSTSARRFNLTGNLVSRTPKEASQNAKYIDLIRSWLLPDFGASGATPPILRLSGYANNNIDNVPVVLNTYSITFPDNVDYIFQGGLPMPVIMNITLDLSEAYSPAEVTAKKWKIHISEGGSFVYGVGNTVPAGGVGPGDSISNIASGGSFPGIASMKMPSIATAGNLLGGSPALSSMESLGGLGAGLKNIGLSAAKSFSSLGIETPNNASALGNSDSPSVSDSTPISSPEIQDSPVRAPSPSSTVDQGDDEYRSNIEIAKVDIASGISQFKKLGVV